MSTHGWAMARAVSSGALACLLTVALLGGGCSVDKETQITVALSSETEIPKELDSFSVHVISTRTGELRFSQDYFPTSGREFPTTLAVIPLDEGSIGSPLRIELEGRKQGATFLRRVSVISYFEGRNILLTMPLRMACFQFRDCGPSATCAGGQCVPTEVSPASLADYDAKLVFPSGAEGSCFDEEKCLDAPVAIQVEPDCTFSLPAAGATSGNVSIRWAAAAERILALDESDAQEGWVRLSSLRGRLSQGACDSHFGRLGADGKPLVADSARTVYFSAACPSKTSRLPYCYSAVTQHAGVGAVRPAP